MLIYAMLQMETFTHHGEDGHERDIEAASDEHKRYISSSDTDINYEAKSQPL